MVVFTGSAALGQQAGDNPGAGKAETQNSQTLQDLKQAGWSRSRFHHAHETSVQGNQIIEKPQPRLAEFQSTVGPILGKACFDCHGSSEQEGNIRVDTLDPNLHSGNDVDWWNEVLAVVSKGEMPPPDSTELTEEDRKKVVEWLVGELQTASILRRNKASNSAFRRLTRYEYNYAMQDMLGLPWDFAKDLPPESTSEDGFQNSSAQLHMTVSQLETYHRLARTALARALTLGEKPMPLYWGITMRDASKLEWPKQEQQLAKAKEAHKDDSEKLQAELQRLEASFRKEHARSYYRNLSNQQTAVATWEYDGAKYAIAPSNEPVEMPGSLDHVAVLPAGQWINLELGNQLPDEGSLRVRVRATKTKDAGPRSPSLQLHFGWQASNEGRALLRVSQEDVEVSNESDAPKFYQWDIPLGEIYPRNNVRKSSPMGALPSPSEYIRLVNSSASSDAIVIDYVEVQAPVYDQWPAPSHQRIFGQNVSSNEAEAAQAIIAKFLTKAWRKPASKEDCDKKMRLFETVRGDCDSFEEAVAEVLATILSSPNFLYVVQDTSKPLAVANEGNEGNIVDRRTKLSSHELATRLSIFLWCSIPDSDLLEAASNNSLLDNTVLAGQVDRMLKDPRSKRFSQHFVEQWLNMELLEFLNLNQHLPGFDPLLKEAMQHEPVSLFEEMLRNNESVLNFIHADYAMVNERLARHYGIQDVTGNQFRRVPLNRDFKLGGLMTQAGLLAMNSDYPDSHPLKRGKWLLVSLLNDPPPPPPPAVPQIDLANPEIAKMTLKERIEDHRNHAACMSCHAKIDPWGIAFENYDAVGRWRDDIKGQPVDASSELFNRETLDGMNGLKRFLLENRQDQFVSALVHKLATFALGRPLKFSDRADLDAITARVRKSGDGLRDLIVALVTSELFQTK